jgi:Bax protein
MRGASFRPSAPSIWGGAAATRACALIAALTLLALAVQPRLASDDGHEGWRLPLGFGLADIGVRRWVLSLPLPVEETEDGPLLMLGAAEAPRASPVAPRLDLRSYALDAVRDGESLVPRLLLERLPSSLTGIEAGDLRKRLFIKAMLPALLAENERLVERRARLLDLLEVQRSGHMLLVSEQRWLDDLAERYGVDADDAAELLRRVDVVPPSLALAQAALESGWGTSRGAQQGHSMFGHMAVSTEPGRSVLRQFDSMPEAIAAYVHNLNTHRAYAAFRDARARQRARDLPADGHELAGALLRYSERGDSYVRDVRALIRANRLDGFDRARLGG